MLCLLSPAKTLNLKPQSRDLPWQKPRLLPQAAELAALLQPYSPAQLADLMGISLELAVLNVGRFQAWHAHYGPADGALPALQMFAGDVYEGLQVAHWSAQDWTYGEAHVRVLSGLYGLLRPTDAILPYRLEMGTALTHARGRGLPVFWRPHLTALLQADMQAAGAHHLLNLASEEYFKAVDGAALGYPVISPVFQDWKNGQYKIISFYAKRARGLMARYMVQQQVTDPLQLQDFALEGYAYCEQASSAMRPVFRRREG